MTDQHGPGSGEVEPKRWEGDAFFEDDLWTDLDSETVPADPGHDGRGDGEAGYDVPADDVEYAAATVPAGRPARAPRRRGPRRPGGDRRRSRERVMVDPDDGHEYVELPPRGSLPKWVLVLGALVLTVALLLGGVMFWYQRQINPPGPPGDTVTVEIPEGSSTSGVSSILDREGVIGNSWVFTFYAGRKDAGPFDAGVYELRQNSDFDSVIETLEEGPTGAVTTGVVRVAIAEGLTVDQMLNRIADQAPQFEVADLRAALDGGDVTSELQPDSSTSFEGLMFPATYELGGSTSAAEFLNDLTDEMETRVGRLDVAAAKERVKEQWGLELSTYDLLTVASMIQAEAGNAEEAPQIATVIYNRLAADMPLGIDAVDRYGAELDGTPVDYEDTEAPYNTRRSPGLPPTPISAPGEFALEAALAPADGDWMYYVLEAPNVHTFVTTDAEFQAAKQRCIELDLGCG